MTAHRRRTRWLALAGALVAAGSGAWLWAGNASTGAAPAPAVGPVATATVERGAIALTLRWDGTLDHGSPLTITSPNQGTITRLPDQDATVARGEELYRIDERPVILLYGVVPMYRDLRPGDSGVDVEQLEANLAELGYGGFTVDDQYTAATGEAVRGWQADLGTEPTSTLGRRAVVFLPGAVLVDTVRAGVGQAILPGAAVVDLTGTDQLVSLEVDLDDRDRLETGTEVSIVLPDGDRTTGTVTATTLVEAPPTAESEAAASIVRVEVAVAEPAADEDLGATVEVEVVVEERPDVLLVPVNALLALAEGGYGLELVAPDGSTSIVPVETGLFADGKVEVRSPGITEGAVVGVAGR